jgi:siderophore synthetase component
MDNQTIAEQATMQSFLNCYLRETRQGQFLTPTELEKIVSDTVKVPKSTVDEWVRCSLSQQQIEIIASLAYHSPTGRHLFAFPFYYRTQAQADWHPLDYVTLVTLLTKELTLEHALDRFPDELISRVLQSKQLIGEMIEARSSQLASLYETHFDFLEAEQSLLFGHLLHPTPKSRQGLSESEQKTFSPEFQGRFPLHYFVVDRSIVQEDSLSSQSASSWIKEELRHDEQFDQQVKKAYLDHEQSIILPVHPVQARYLLQQPAVQHAIDQQLIIDTGVHGKDFYPTSSLRTVYHPESRLMYKCSLHIQITNSRRLNKRKELERGVEIARLLETPLGEELAERYPRFQIIRDPAYITIKLGHEEESGFELVLRENPFMEQEGEQVILIAGLCQDAVPPHSTRLYHLIHEIAQKEGRRCEEVSLDWFRQYLEISLQPMMWLYQTYGLALEAHQQNSVVRLENGYPAQFYYRDNQGYYYCESTLPLLQQLLPNINEKSHTVCPDAVVDERFRYYLFFNHLIGLIQSFGASRLIAEERLLALLREAVQEWVPANREPSTLLHSLLHKPTVTCKGNLLTRLYDMDELIGDVAHQSKYVTISNPLYKGGKHT